MSNLISSGNSIMGFYVTYSRMKSLMNYFKNTCYANSDHITIYIDINSVTKELFLYKMPMYGANEIASSILNMVAHYRHYFKSRHKVETRFFLVDSDNVPTDAQLSYPDYNMSNLKLRMQRPDIMDAVNEARDLVCMLSKYIPDVYYLPADNYGIDAEVSTKIMYSILRPEETEFYKKYNAPNIVISKDVHMNLLEAKLDNVYILRPRKKDSMDISSLITPENAVETVMGKTALSKYPDYEVAFSNNDIVRYYIMHGMDSRNIRPILNQTETVRYLYDANMVHHYKSLIEFIMNAPEQATLNRNLLDPALLYNNYITHLSIHGDPYPLYKVKCIDPDILKKYNESGFRNCPVMLDKL